VINQPELRSERMWFLTGEKLDFAEVDEIVMVESDHR
jgi:hypothetical protein